MPSCTASDGYEKAPAIRLTSREKSLWGRWLLLLKVVPPSDTRILTTIRDRMKWTQAIIGIEITAVESITALYRAGFDFLIVFTEVLFSVHSVASSCLQSRKHDRRFFELKTVGHRGNLFFSYRNVY